MEMKLLIIAMLAGAAWAQQPAAFEVATIKLNKSGARAIDNTWGPARMSWTNVPLRVLIKSAYGIQDYQIGGTPAWTVSERWDVEGKTEREATMPEMRERLQALLADRFQLKSHWEARELPQYKLVIAKSGIKLSEYKTEEGDTRPVGSRVERGSIAGRGVPFPTFLNLLRGQLGRPIVDATGLSARYDFRLEWVPDESQPNSGGDSPPPDAAGPSIFAAIQEQLGLKLEAIKGPVEVLVIDHVEKPTEN
jgi:uncharacterized protein (TIGR03435 family)